MKHSQTPDNLKRGRADYIDSRWKGLGEFVRRSEDRVLNYVFVLNTGSLTAALTYVATKASNSLIRASIVCSALGVLAILLHAAWCYYRAERFFRAYQREVRGYFVDEVEWEVLKDRDEVRTTGSLVGHGLGWLAGLLFFAALLCGTFGVW